MRCVSACWDYGNANIYRQNADRDADADVNVDTDTYIDADADANSDADADATYADKTTDVEMTAYHTSHEEGPAGLTRT